VSRTSILSDFENEKRAQKKRVVSAYQRGAQELMPVIDHISGLSLISGLAPETQCSEATSAFGFDAAWKTVEMDAGLQKQPPLKSILDRPGRFLLCPRITHSVGTKSLRDGHATDFHERLLSK
jgi:hypothetical protein